VHTFQEIHGDGVNDAERLAHLAILQEQLGYTFRDAALLDRSLTHTSYTHELNAAQEDYERLEFLGDAVLGLIIGAYLYRAYPTASEGQLSILRARIVSESGLAALAYGLDLGRFLRLGRGEEQTGGRHKDSILAAALEAMIGAVYLEGGLLQAQEVFLGCFASTIEENIRSTQESDYKGLLQGQALSAFGCLPAYRVIREEGPAHQKTFHVQLTVNREYRCVGVGRSKKAAEQQAAKQLLEQLLVEPRHA
jgi:ribonuclease III